MQTLQPDDHDDPKGLIRESFRIEGITEAECRSILIDWALSLPPGREERAALARLAARHAVDQPAHPMARLIAQALAVPAPGRPVRRGGRAGKLAPNGGQRRN